MTDPAQSPARNSARNPAQNAAPEAAPAGIAAAIEDLPLTLSIRLGSATLSIAELSGLGEGSTLALSTRIDDPLEVCIEDRVVARGELTETAAGLAVTLTEVVG